MHTQRVSGGFACSLLIAGAVSAAALLGGCNDSATAEANRKAAEASGKAAARTSSAGEYRPTDALIEKSHGKEAAQSLENQVRGSAGSPESLRQFIDKKTVTADLKDASALLSEALSSGNATPPEDLYKGQVQAQMGQVQLQQAQEQLTLLQADLVKLSRQASAMLILADRAAVLGGSAKTIEGKIPVPPSIDASLSKARTEAQAAATIAKQKTGVVTALDNQVKTLQQKAKALETQGATAAAKSERETGMASVDSMKEAINLRGQADKINADVASLQPKLQAAKADADVALVAQKAAEDTIATLLRAKDNIARQSEARTGQSNTLRDQSIKLIQGPDGLAAQAREFKMALADLTSKLEVARSAAGNAKGKFGESLSSLRNYRKWVDEVKETLPPKDPLLAARNRKTPESLLLTFQANASYRAAQAETIGLLATMLQNQVSDAVSRAYQLSGDTTENVLQSGGDADVNRAREAARKELEVAVRLAEQAVAIETDNNSLSKYLGYATQAAVYQGMYAVTGEDSAKAGFEKAAQEAAARNPSAIAAAAAAQ